MNSLSAEHFGIVYSSTKHYDIIVKLCATTSHYLVSDTFEYFFYKDSKTCQNDNVHWHIDYWFAIQQTCFLIQWNLGLCNFYHRIRKSAKNINTSQYTRGVTVFTYDEYLNCIWAFIIYNIFMLYVCMVFDTVNITLNCAFSYICFYGNKCVTFVNVDVDVE